MIYCSGQYLHDRVHGFWRRDPQAVDEPALDAALGEETRHLLAAAVDHDHLIAVTRGLGDLAGEARAQIVLIEQRASQLHQDSQSSPSVSANPSARFMFCTACPAAP